MAELKLQSLLVADRQPGYAVNRQLCVPLGFRQLGGRRRDLADGNITEIHCTYDPKSRSGSGTEESQRKVKGTLHWVSKKHAIPVEVRQYDRLFMDEAPDAHKDRDFMEFLNPDSLHTVTGYAEPSLADVQVGDRFQFQRLGYFNVDKDSTSEKIVFNKTVGLRDNWAKKNQ